MHVLEEGKLSTPHGRQRRQRAGNSRLAELGRSELGTQRAAYSGQLDSGSSDDTADEVKQRRRATAQALVSHPHRELVPFIMSNPICTTARTGTVSLKRPERDSSAVSRRRLRPSCNEAALRTAPIHFRSRDRSRSRRASHVCDQAFQSKKWRARRSRSACSSNTRHFRKVFAARLLLLLESTWRLLPRARSPLLLCDNHVCSMRLYWRKTSWAAGVPTRLLPLHDPEPRKFTKRKSLATLDSCEATCTSSFRRAACALKLLVGCTLRPVESWEARVERVEVAFCSFPREMAVSQHSSRAPPSQRPRSC